MGKWKSAYEQAVREHEQLRNGRGALLGAGEKGGLDAAEWRDRFEACVAEKQALLERLDMLVGGAGGVGARGQYGAEMDLGQQPSKTLEKAYLDLRNEYKVADALLAWIMHSN